MDELPGYSPEQFASKARPMVIEGQIRGRHFRLEGQGYLEQPELPGSVRGFARLPAEAATPVGWDRVIRDDVDALAEKTTWRYTGVVHLKEQSARFGADVWIHGFSLDNGVIVSLVQRLPTRTEKPRG